MWKTLGIFLLTVNLFAEPTDDVFVKELDSNEYVSGGGISPDNKYVVAYMHRNSTLFSKETNSVIAWDIAAGNEVSRNDQGGAPVGRSNFIFSRDGKNLFGFCVFYKNLYVMKYSFPSLQVLESYIVPLKKDFEDRIVTISHVYEAKKTLDLVRLEKESYEPDGYGAMKEVKEPVRVYATEITFDGVVKSERLLSQFSYGNKPAILSFFSDQKHFIVRAGSRGEWISLGVREEFTTLGLQSTGTRQIGFTTELRGEVLRAGASNDGHYLFVYQRNGRKDSLRIIRNAFGQSDAFYKNIPVARLATSAEVSEDLVSIVNDNLLAEVTEVTETSPGKLRDFFNKWGSSGIDALNQFGLGLLKTGEVGDYPPYLSSELIMPSAPTYKDEPSFTLRVTNTGKSAAYQLVGQVNSDFLTASKSQLFFGALEPGQTVERTYRFKKPGTAAYSGQVLDFSVEFSELNQFVPVNRTEGRIEIQELTKEFVVSDMFVKREKYKMDELIDLRQNKIIDDIVLVRYIAFNSDDFEFGDLLSLARKYAPTKTILTDWMLVKRRAVAIDDLSKLITEKFISSRELESYYALHPKDFTSDWLVQNGTPAMVQDALFVQELPFSAAQVKKLAVQKTLSVNSAQRAILGWPQWFSPTDLADLGPIVPDLSLVVERLVAQKRLNLDASGMMALYRAKLLTPFVVEKLIGDRAVASLTLESILDLASKGAISRSLVDELYEKKQVQFTPAAIAHLIKTQRMSSSNVGYRYRVDEVVGNHDGRIQKGEGVDIQFTLTNVSRFDLKNAAVTITTTNPNLVIKNPQATFPVFLRQTQAQDGTVQLRSPFTLKPGFQGTKIAFHITAVADDFKTILDADIVVPYDENPAVQISAIAKTVQAKQTLTVYSAASDKSPEFAQANEGAIFNVSGLLDNMYRVTAGKEAAWIKTKDVIDYVDRPDTSHVFDNALVAEALATVPTLNNKVTLGTLAPASPQSLVTLSNKGMKPVVFAAVSTPLTNGKSYEKSVDLTVSALDPSGLKKLQVKVNGKAPLGTEKGLELTDKKVTKTLKINLSAGQNTIEVSVENVDGLSDSADPVTILYGGKQVKPNLYLLSVGIGTYKFLPKESQLTFPTRDAADIAAAFKNQQNKQFDKVLTKVLTDTEVTRPNIRKTMTEFFGQAGSDDTLMLFFAGHGVQVSSSDYYYVTYDSDPSDYSAASISKHDLEEVLNKQYAANTLLFLDTCNSGALLTMAGARGLSVVGDEETKVAQGFAGRGKTFVLAAAPEGKAAYEDPKLGNGFFTHALLGGLKGGADQNGDKMISLVELRKYVNETAPKLSGGKQKSVAAPSLDETPDLKLFQY